MSMPNTKLLIGFDLGKAPVLLEDWPRIRDTTDTYRIYIKDLFGVHWYKPNLIKREWAVSNETRKSIPEEWKTYLLLLSEP